MSRGPRPRPVRDRLLPRLVIDPSGCLLWTGCLDRDGYGRINVGGSGRLVHRVMFELFEGPIPDGLEPDHTCRVRRCASLAHLELVTHRTNMLRSETVFAERAAQTHCQDGHEFDLINTYFRAGGGRECRKCNAARQRRRVAIRKASA